MHVVIAQTGIVRNVPQKKSGEEVYRSLIEKTAVFAAEHCLLHGPDVAYADDGDDRAEDGDEAKPTFQNDEVNCLVKKFFFSEIALLAVAATCIVPTHPVSKQIK